MSRKSELKKNAMYRMIRRELAKLYGESVTNQIIVLAEKHYADSVRLCGDAPKGEWTHLNNTILPTVSIYKALLELDPKNALNSAHTVMMNVCKIGGAFTGCMLMLPGMKSAFMWFLPRMANRMFGPSCGFQFENYQVSKRCLKMDMTACPYCRYAMLFGTPELMPVFCDSDFAVYGNLPGIRFERTKTLGTGGECCDFRFVRE